MAARPLVILDCDGVLVDSEPLSNRLLAEELTRAGLPTTVADSYERYLGRSWADNERVAEELLGRPLPADLRPRFLARLTAALEAELQPVPGIVGALDALATAGVPTCVASSGEHEKIALTLGATGLAARFEGRVFSAADVARGKPAPDLFLHAAARCGAAPARCVVVEDSPAGVAAGRAAGMRVLAYAGPGRTPAHRLADADEVFSDMAELPALVLAA